MGWSKEIFSITVSYLPTFQVRMGNFTGKWRFLPKRFKATYHIGGFLNPGWVLYPPSHSVFWETRKRKTKVPKCPQWPFTTVSLLKYSALCSDDAHTLPLVRGRGQLLRAIVQEMFTKSFSTSNSLLIWISFLKEVYCYITKMIPSVASYLLLCNKLFQNLAASNKTHFFSHRFGG